MRLPLLQSKGTRRLRRWLIPAALLAVAPKCVLCMLAYFGLATALGLVGPELCGGSAGSAMHWPAWLAIIAITVVVLGGFTRSWRRPRQTAPVRSLSDPRNFPRA